MIENISFKNSKSCNLKIKCQRIHAWLQRTSGPPTFDVTQVILETLHTMLRPENVTSFNVCFNVKTSMRIGSCQCANMTFLNIRDIRTVSQEPSFLAQTKKIVDEGSDRILGNYI